MFKIDLQTGKFLPFQTLMHRRRKYKIEDAIKDYPVILNLFDILFYDNKDKTILPLFQRREILEQIFQTQNQNKKIKLIKQKEITDIAEINRFMSEVI